MKKFMLKVFDFVNGVVAVVAILSALMIDTISWTPCIVFGCCLVYGICAMYIKDSIKEGEF